MVKWETKSVPLCYQRDDGRMMRFREDAIVYITNKEGQKGWESFGFDLENGVIFFKRKIDSDREETENYA
jgi:hypothetical protein